MGIVLLGTALALGLRHGVDWDHIAAIADISGSQDNKRSSFVNAMSYSLGHGLVIIAFGLLAVMIGVRLPAWVDSLMEPVVGITLIILGIWLLAAIITQKNNFKLVSKWGLIFKTIRRVKRAFTHSHNHTHSDSDSGEPVGIKAAFGIGMIHGIGAETPTQLLIFVTAAGVGGALLGNLLVLSFVLGLLISNAFIALVAIYGFTSVQNSPKLYMSLGAVSGIFSLVLGILFLTGNGAVLPAMLAG